jgi:type IV pilus assembly protein PilF
MARYLSPGTVVRSILLACGMACGVLLQGCVTETSGGFNVQRSDEQSLKYYLQLATGYLEQNDLAASKRHLANAAAIEPNNSEIHAIWGLVYSREGEAKLADDSFQHALQLDTRNSKARNNYAAFLFANNRFEEAYDQLQRVVQDTEYEGRPQAFENLGLAALRLNRTQDAESAFMRALQLNSQQLRSSLELASLNLATNKVLQARQYFRNYLTLLSFYNLGHNARSLWIGIQLESALGNTQNVQIYGTQLETNFASAPEYELYKQLRESQNND